ncbi:MAG: restriction endonuclease subunit S [Lactobacillus iners]|uniref:restriction endonuclease subunit S n=1 Tax=Lactobacillus iners TaxID=147802 RepID=UPI001F09EB3C|nr:restriction endonuclease subunit S [Lactobacillus iners]MCT7677854.1 restriction endonuclease subunit S [Lactobacillus iners]MCT7692608.1 restriction endonuclease subunit S [Lactobacillus iners]MCT7746524.1 restriction endonuclease subunit S [Lactobacillus iners]MCT7771279.1 restriction endonuclease subunit S [Lactobacillus iners]MCT7792880.1 restriction endonuclease subunit S [Lactobacillus iners]
MVNSAARKLEKELIEVVEVPKDDINWSTVSLSDVLNKGKRLEASVFDVESKHIRDVLKNGKYPLVQLDGKDGLIEESFYPGRFKRIYCEKQDGIAFYLPSQMTDIYPEPTKWISKLTNVSIDDLKLKNNTLLLTRSGTIGNVTIVSKTLENKVFSDDVIRTSFKNEEDLGYVYAFLKSEYGSNILKTNSYGSVITHIEPEHFKEMLIPDAPYSLKKKIHDLIIQSYNNRDESNRLIDEATKILIDELELPSIEELKKEAFSYSKDINSFSTKLSNLNGRLEGNYHLPLVEVIEKHSSKKASLIKLNSEDIVEKIILAGVFKRNYVQKGHGYPFLGGKEITQLCPETDKYLSKITHKKRYDKELKVKENWILVTDRGTIGKTVLVPKQMDGMAVSQNVLKIVPKMYSGYLYCFLNSEYGQLLIKRQSYGSVVNMIDDICMGNIKIPMLSNKDKLNEIDNMVLESNKLKYIAYKKEQEAINIMNKEVLGL